MISGVGMLFMAMFNLAPFSDTMFVFDAIIKHELNQSVSFYQASAGTACEPAQQRHHRIQVIYMTFHRVTMFIFHERCSASKKVISSSLHFICKFLQKKIMCLH